jgi:hypothetical protein
MRSIARRLAEFDRERWHGADVNRAIVAEPARPQKAGKQIPD